LIKMEDEDVGSGSLFPSASRLFASATSSKNDSSGIDLQTSIEMEINCINLS
jgi:hypothetical protein